MLSAAMAKDAYEEKAARNAPQPAAGSYEAAFREWLDSQSGYVGKTKKAEFKNDWHQNQNSKTALSNIMSGGPTPFSMSGSAKEMAGRIEGLERAKILTGQNPYEIGKDYQDAYGMIKKRTNQSDTASELLRANVAGATADARNTMQAQGVKGGAAAKAISEIERGKSYDVNNQLVQAQRQAQMDYMNATKSNANFTIANEMNFGAMGAGKDAKMPMNNSGGFGNLGTVICTELFKQGLMDRKTFMADFNYGVEVLRQRPHVYWGYRYMADPIVKMMRKSRLVTKLVSFFVLPWAKNTAGEENLMGKVIGVICEPICGIVGKTIIFLGERHENKKAYVTERNR
jgi:hypothetical protein